MQNESHRALHEIICGQAQVSPTPSGRWSKRQSVGEEDAIWAHTVPSMPVPHAENTNTAHGTELCQQGEALLESL